MPEPTDTTAARRALLALLLDRIESGELAVAERPLIRPLVVAEQGAADARPTALITFHDDATSAAVRPLLNDLDASRRRAEQAETVTRHAKELLTRRTGTLLTRAERAEATIARVRTVRDRIAASKTGELDLIWVFDELNAALDTPSEATDDATATPVLDALRNGQPIWRGPIEGYGTGQMLGFLDTSGVASPPSATSEGVFCSPLVNQHCPGHTDSGQCERASSRRAPTFLVDCGRCGASVEVPGDVTLTGDGTLPGHTCLLAADAPSEPAGCWSCKHLAHRSGACTERNGAESCRCGVDDAPSEPQQ